MFAKSTLFVAASMAASVMAHAATPAGVHRRELVYQLRQLSERAEIYGGGEDSTSVPAEFTQPAFVSGYDAVVNGELVCGPGRTPAASGTECELAITEAPFAISGVLAQDQPVGQAITWDTGISGPSEAMNVYTCAAICADDSICKGFYFKDLTCWKIGGDGAYASTDASIPFTPDTPSTRMAKRAAATTGTFASGGQIALATEPTANAPSGQGCLSSLGDVANTDLTCTCGPGRITISSGVCGAAPTTAGRMSRKARRTIDTPW